MPILHVPTVCQLVDVVSNPQGRQFLDRDVRAVCKWFLSRGMIAEVADPEAVLETLLEEGRRIAAAGVPA